MWGSAERKLFLLYSSGSVQDVYSVGQFGLYWRQSRAKKQRWTKSKWNKWGNSSALGCNPVASPPTQPSKLPIMQGAASAACIVVNNNYILNKIGFKSAKTYLAHPLVSHMEPENQRQEHLLSAANTVDDVDTIAAAHPWCKSPSPPHPEGAVQDWDQVTV